MQLCEQSTLGKYMIGLSIASKVDAQPFSPFKALIERMMQNCWLVQEGYATIAQLSFCLRTEGYGSDMAERLLGMLPKSYQGAVSQLKVKRSILDSHKFEGFKQAEIDEMVAHERQILAFIVCKAAMSIPLTSVLSNALALPAIEVTAHINANAPDIRLERLLPLLVHEVHSQYCKMVTVQPDQSVVCELLAEWACGQVKLSYESADSITVKDILPKFGYPNLMTLPPSDESPVVEKFAHIVAPYSGHKIGLPSGTIAEAKQQAEVTLDRVGREAELTIVAEIMGVDDGIADLTLHLFFPIADVRRALLRIIGYWMDPVASAMFGVLSSNVDHLYFATLSKLPDDWPCKLLSLVIRSCSTNSLPQIPHEFGSSHMHWLVAESTLSSLDHSALLAKGSLDLCLSKEMFLWNSPNRVYRINAVNMAPWVVVNADQANALPGSMEPRASEGDLAQSFFGVTGVDLCVYNQSVINAEGTGILRPKLVVEGQPEQEFSYKYSCLCEVLISGQHSHIVFNTAKR